MGTEQEDHGALARLLAWVAGSCCRHPWWVLFFALTTCAASIVYTCQHLTYQTQRSDLLNKRKDFYQRWQQILAEFGDDDDMVVVVEGHDRARMRQALDRIAAEIQERPTLFDRLFYRVDLSGLRNRALLFLPTEQIRRIQDNLKNMSLLLEPPVLGALNSHFGWQMLTVQQLLNEGDRRAATLATDAVNRSEEEPMLRQLNAICVAAALTLRNPADYRNPWQSILPEAPQTPNTASGIDPLALLGEPQYFFSGDSRLAMLMVRPLKDPEEGFTFARKSIDGLRDILEKLKPAFPDLEFGLTGLPVLENDEMVASNHDSESASWLALAGVALLYFFVYRGFRYPLMTVSAMLIGTAWALGWLTLTVGHLNILSSAFAVMLIGLGDYGVLWVTRFTLERRAGADLHEATRNTALYGGPSILIAALTTTLAFYAAMFADLRAVAELGWIAGSGVFLCAVSCFTIMPALLALFDVRPRRAQAPEVLPLAPRQDIRRAWLPGLARRPRGVLGLSLLATAVLAWCAWHVHYDHNILHMQDPRLDSVHWEHALLEHSQGDSWNAVTMTTTPEEALALKARYEQLPTVSRVIEVASLVPGDQERKLEALRDIQQRLRRLPPRGTVIQHPEPSLPEVQRAAQKVWQALDRLETTPLIAELREHVRELIHALQAGNQADTTARLQEFQKRMTSDLIEDLHRLRDVSKPASIRVADLPVCLRERYIGQSGKWLLRVFAKEDLWNYEPLERFVGDIKAADPEACGRPFSTLEGLKAMHDGFLWAGVYALIAIVLVLLVDFGNVKHTLLALLPLSIGMIASLGILTLCGIALNPANMIAFPIILGVGVNYGIHVLHNYRERRRGPQYTLSYVIGRGVAVAALTTTLGFGALTISRHRGLASLGLALSLGVTVCMLTALIILPPLLSMISRRRQVLSAAWEPRRREPQGCEPQGLKRAG